MNIFSKALRKIYYMTVGKNPFLDRLFRYRGNPQDYWVKRGGQTYFEEQEAVRDRTERSLFIAGEVSKLPIKSLLEIGCGYGKQLRNIRSMRSDLTLGGCDFSRTQLQKGFEFFPEMAQWAVEADASKLPFEDKSFDAVMSSAVILHNQYPKAQKIIAQMIRVSRKYLIHNEDTDITFSRYGYDMAKTYRAMGFKIVVSQEIPCSQDPSCTQFTVAEIPDNFHPCDFKDVPLQYHKDPKAARP
jgi:SAM-dependent methyltransferase